MKKTIWFLAIITLLQTHVYGQTIFNNYIDGQIYFKIKNEVPFRFNTTSPDIQINSDLPFLSGLAEKFKVSKVEASFYFSNDELLKRTFRIYFSKKELIGEFINELQLLQQTDYAEKVPLHSTAIAPNDLGANSIAGQYALYNIHAQEAWDLIRNNNTVKIAVVDNAMETSHNDLSGILLSARDVADLDNNANAPNNTSGWDHGTHCSGIACAQTDNGIGIASIAFGSKLMAVKATPDTGNGNFIYYGYEGITWAAANGANVISCSWGSTNNFTITGQNVINAAYNNNIVIVACAQNYNEDSLVYPAAYANVLSVSNVDINDVKSATSNFGTWVDVAAPGEDIRSTVFGNAYGSKTGTSMSTPLVAGLCALIKSINPLYTNTQIVNCIKNNADNIDALNPGFAGLLGTGRINAYRAVKCALTCIGNTNYGTASMGVAKPVSSGTITSANNIIVGGDVTFDAAVEVILQPNFIANTGCIFNARIDGCANPPLYSNGTRNEIENENSFAGDHLITIYPNPANDFIIIKIKDAQNKGAIKIYNCTMQLTKSFQFDDIAEKNVSISDLPSGIYFIDTLSGDHSYRTKFIINR